MSHLQLRNRLDAAINKLCSVRNTISRSYDVDFQINETLGNVEESIEALAQEVDSEVSDYDN